MGRLIDRYIARKIDRLPCTVVSGMIVERGPAVWGRSSGPPATELDPLKQNATQILHILQAYRFLCYTDVSFYTRLLLSP